MDYFNIFLSLPLCEVQRLEYMNVIIIIFLNVTLTLYKHTFY